MAQQAINKRTFETDDALKAAFNGKCGKWQLLIYALLVFAYAVITGWTTKMLNYSLLRPEHIDCDYFENLYGNKNYTINSIIQRLTGKDKYAIPVENGSNATNTKLLYNYTEDTGKTVITQFHLFCDLASYADLPLYTNVVGTIVGALLLGFLADKGGRKIVILSCIWITGLMSVFQLVGHDFISFVFFELFLAIFNGGVQAVFLPYIIEMFPIAYRTFYGVLFHVFVCLFEVVFPLIARAIKNWTIVQTIASFPLILTAPLQFIAFESIFWYLAHKNYDKVIQSLTKLARRNGISFEDKFEKAKEFLHAKQSKAVQVDILPLMRLQDAQAIGQKYTHVFDMAEAHKKSEQNSKLRRFLNSLKGNHYRSTNTTYYPFDFIYSPTLFVYVLILSGLWFVTGLCESIEAVHQKHAVFDKYIEMSLVNLTCLSASIMATILAIIKIRRKFTIFFAYLVVDIALLSSLITKYNVPESKDKVQVGLYVIYYTCKFAQQFGIIFVTLITAELFPTSLRCTGIGIGLTFKLIGYLIASPKLLDKSDEMHRLSYGLIALVFASLALFLPETKSYPLPRSILQIEARNTVIGKRLRSRKVKLACEKRQLEFKPRNAGDDDIYKSNKDPSKRYLSGASRSNEAKALLSSTQNDHSADETRLNQTNANLINHHLDKNYDTVTSVHDIEQDAHAYYAGHSKYDLNCMSPIAEVPSKNITRNNSIVDASDIGKSDK